MQSYRAAPLLSPGSAWSCGTAKQGDGWGSSRDGPSVCHSIKVVLWGSVACAARRRGKARSKSQHSRSHVERRQVQRSQKAMSQVRRDKSQVGKSQFVATDPGNAEIAAEIAAGIAESHDLLDLAQYTVLCFVEGGYPVIRQLKSVEQSEDEEVLIPGNPNPADPLMELRPDTWAPFHPDGEAHRLFYKLALGGHCSEVSYFFLELFNAVKAGQQPVSFRGEDVQDMRLCVGYVAHAYRRLRLAGDFGMNYWQHSQEVHCGARNHVWLEFSVPAGENFVLDLTGIQFDMTGPRDMMYIHHCRVSDETYKHYQKCYEISSNQMPVHFLHWSLPRRMSAASVQGWATEVICANSCMSFPDPGITVSFVAGVVASKLAGFNAFFRLNLEDLCGLTLEEVEEKEAAAAREMYSKLGVGNPYGSANGSDSDACSVM